jgi:DNA polymerase-3 subunit epsilon
LKKTEQILDRLAKADLPKSCFFSLLDKCDELRDFEISSTDDLRCLGLDVEEEGKNLRLGSRIREWREQKFCVVDIETNNLPPNDAKVIEIGAVMLKNGAVLDEFHSLIFTDFLPDNIVNLTGITTEMLKNSPSEISVLEQFRLFLGESIFVAHNADFDYTFLSRALKKHKAPPFLNRKLCTIKLAKKTIKSPKYGLQTMREILGINDGVLHRALDDAKSAAEVLKAACENLPKWVVSAEDLIGFSNSNKQHLQPKLPFINEV